MRILLLVFTLLLGLPAVAKPLREVPSPRPSGWVSDTVGLLDAPSLKSLNEKLEAFHREQGAEMAVVVVDSADGVASKAYAHDLFNLWGVGRKGYNDGVLMVVFEKDHRIEIEVGEGCRQIMPDNRTAEILQKVIVPEFRARRAKYGISSGVNAMCETLTPVWGSDITIEDPKHFLKPADLRKMYPALKRLQDSHIYALIRIEPKRPNVAENAKAALAKRAFSPQCVVFVGDAKSGSFACCAGNEVVPEGLTKGRKAPKDSWAATIEKSLNRYARKAPPPAPPAPVAAPESSSSGSQSSDYSLLWMGGLGTLGVGGSAWMLSRRHVPRKCPNCSQQMRKLSESEEDEFLDAGQQAEELAGSVDYDVWICHACDVTNIQRYGAWLTSMKSCRSCSYKTLESSRTELESATEYSEGRGRTDYYCRHCGYKSHDYYTIARISSSSSDSSSSDSSYSSSSSSGFSGGSSDGGGAGASW